MAFRTTEEVLEQFRRMLPGHYETAEALLAGYAAALSRAEQARDELRPRASIGGASGAFLTLQARGYGVDRASGESDAALRTRLRRVEDQVTRPAIEAAVNSIISPDTCTVIEWWEQPFLDYDGDVGLWLDNQNSLLSGGPSSFLILIPRQSTEFSFGTFLDEPGLSGLWLDSVDAFIGDGPEDPKYSAIINDIERIRAAGVTWRLVLEQGT